MTAAFIKASGVAMLAHRAMGHVSNLDIGLLSNRTAFDQGLAVDRRDADAIMLACGNWLTLGTFDRLEPAIGKPVLATNQVGLWAALRLVGHQAPVFGWGRLLREHMA